MDTIITVTTTAYKTTSTRSRLLRAAEQLFADHGVAGTSTRAILREAGQRNESALQYHFGGREGLIEALYLERGAQVDEQREAMLRELDDNDDLSVRRLCELAFLPPVKLAQRDPEFATFLKVVGQLAFLPSQKLQESQARYEGAALARVKDLLKTILDLPPELVRQRGDLMNRLAAISLAQWARSDRPFDGRETNLFFESVLDAMSAILDGPVSEATERCLASRRRPTSRGRSKSKRRTADP